MKKSLLYIVVLLSLSACGGGEPKVPEDIMPKEKMVSVLEDVHILEAVMSVKNIYGDSALRYSSEAYKAIYKNHHTTKDDFNKSFKYYAKHPKLMDDIYKDVIDELSKKQAEVSKK
jgi:hypothetical protein